MGWNPFKKKKTKTTSVTTVKTEVVKLTYLQTLAISQNLASVQELQTDASNENLGATTKKENLLPAILDPLGVWGSKKTKYTYTTESSGATIKDQWLQPEFDVIRYAIGIRELTASSYVFAPQSELISVPFISPKEVIKVHVLVDHYIPPQFDQNKPWIKYYIKVEGEQNWIRVNPLNTPTKFNDTGDIIPKIINFNTPKPSTAQLEDKYQVTESPVKKLRFKAVFTRPTGGNFDAMTPLLKSYRIIMSPKA